MTVGVAWRLDCPAHGPRPATPESRLEARFAYTVRATCGHTGEVADRDLYAAASSVQPA